MGFLMDGLDAEAYDRKYNDAELVRRIGAYFKPEGGRIGLVGLLIVLISVVDVGLPILISAAIDAMQAGTTASALLGYGMLVAGLGAASWVLNMIRATVASQAVGNVVLAMRQDTFDAVLARDMSFYDSFPTGKIVSRVTSDTNAFSAVVVLVTNLISHLLTIGLLMVYLLSINVQLSLLTMAMVPVIIGVALGFRSLARVVITQSRRVLAEVSAWIQETVSGIRVAKAFRQEEAIYTRFKQVNDQAYWINLRTGWVFASIFPILNTLAGIGTAGLVYFGGLRAQSGALGAGDWYLFIQAIGLFWFPLTSIASFWSQFQLGLAAGERIFALIDAEPAVVQTDTRQPEINGEIVFDRVRFQYNEKEVVLPDFSLEIPAGQTLALVGHTGAGKSSIGKLIARFYEFQAGELRIDGQDARSFDLGHYRRQLGIVTQTPFLFNGTVLENIRYGRPEASDAEVEAAAQQIGGGDWVCSLPAGLASTAGERGSALSMGQRQLVALARVLLQNPRIFILDEATASIDPLTEALIQEGLEHVLRGRTSIVIAHRLSTVQHADRIIVLEKGRIIEEGTHDSLLQAGGHYQFLYDTYFRHQSLDYIERAGQFAPAAVH